MSETTRFALPLLMPSQAQKHVTVNEALLRLDALAQLVLGSRSVSAPPAAPSEGDCYAVPTGASGDWSGRSGQIAVFVGGGWDFVLPGRGWRAFVEDEGGLFLYDDGWSPLQAGEGTSSDGPRFRTISHDHPFSAGPSSTTAPIIPAFASVWGVTGMVTAAVGGATSMEIGVAGSPNRYGSGIGTGEGSWLRGLTGSPLTYWEETSLVLTSEVGSFDGTGTIRILVYAVELPLPL
jgi:Protein of unknown function (DUF2793)